MTFWQTVAAVLTGNIASLATIIAVFVVFIKIENHILMPRRHRRYNEKHGLTPEAK